MNSNTTADETTVSVLLFASLREAAGTDRVQIRLNMTLGQTTVAALLGACAEQLPSLQPWMPYVRVAVNSQYAAAAELLGPADEIALLPPVSGG